MFIVTGFIISSPVSLLPSIATENGVAFILSTNFEVRSIANASFKMVDDVVLPHSYFFAILRSGMNNFPNSSDIAIERLCLAKNTVILISGEVILSCKGPGTIKVETEPCVSPTACLTAC